MKHGIGISINVSKIQKERLFQGKSGKYLDLTLFLDTKEKDQYGNSGMVTQSVSQEERAQGIKGEILGNAKLFYSSGNSDQGNQNQQQNNQHSNQGTQNNQGNQNQPQNNQGVQQGQPQDD